MPPAWLDWKPSWVISSRCVLPCCATAAKPSPTSTPLTALIDNQRAGEFAIELAVNRFAPAGRHAVGDDGDARADRIAGLAQRIHVASSSATCAASGQKNGLLRPRSSRSRAARRRRSAPGAAHAHAELFAQPRLAITAAATRIVVSRADERPPPRGSRMPYFCQ
jgi:hypothetical protein